MSGSSRNNAADSSALIGAAGAAGRGAADAVVSDVEEAARDSQTGRMATGAPDSVVDAAAV